MKSFSQLMEQAPGTRDTIVFAFGRFNPPTTGHELLVKATTMLAQKNNADHIIYASGTQDSKKNPLSVSQKVAYMKNAFPGVNIAGATKEIPTFMSVAKTFNGKYKNLIMIAGSDRVPEYKKLLDKYNGKDFNFDKILVVSAGERDPDADNVTGMSASRMRQLAADNDFAKFRAGAPSKMSPMMVKKMFDDVRQGMKINEEDKTREMYLAGEIFNIGEIVVYEDFEYVVTYRGSNYLIIESDDFEEEKRVWIDDVVSTKKISEAAVIRQQDKIRAAKIIASSLGYDAGENKSDPVEIINMGLRAVARKPLNDTSKQIIKKMLAMASSMDIAYNEKLAPFLQESTDKPVVHPTDDKEHTEILTHPEMSVVKGIVKGLERAEKDETKDEEEQESAEQQNVEKHMLMTTDAGKTEYERLRKIHVRAHESVGEGESDDESEDEEVGEDDLADMVNILSDEELLSAYDDDEFHELDDNGQIKESVEPINEVLSRIERLRSSFRIKRTAAKREMKQRIALKRRSSPAVLSRRARHLAVKTLEKTLAKKPLSQLSVVEKERLEARIARMKPILNRLSMKMLPRIRNLEKTRLEHATTKG